MELDLSNDKNFLSFVTNGEIDPNKKSGGKELEDYLKSKLEAAYPKKYARHFKAFYFAEHGYHPNGGNLSGILAMVRIMWWFLKVETTKRRLMNFCIL